MIKLSVILKELKTVRRVSNHLTKLKQLESQIKSTDDIKLKRQLAIICVKLIYPIWNIYHPEDDRVLKAINAIEDYNNNKIGESKLSIHINQLHNMLNNDEVSFSAAMDVIDAVIYAATDVELDEVALLSMLATREYFKTKWGSVITND